MTGDLLGPVKNQKERMHKMDIIIGLTIGMSLPFIILYVLFTSVKQNDDDDKR